MAYSYVRYSGNGSTTNYTFSFPTISQDHIKVRVNGALVTNWSFLSASTIQFAVAPASAAVIEIRRETPKDSPIVDFADGSVLLERDLDLLATWQLYVAQETEDDLEDTIRVDSQGRFDALNKRIINVADPVNAQDAVTKNWAETAMSSQLAQATSQATAAAGSATAAATSAGNASTSASNAAGSATSASNSATAAAGSATAAANSATAAGTSASDANTSALAAASSATAASDSASTASTQATNAASSAVSAANSAAAAATALDNFDDRYLGQKASDPAVDNDGNALITGALYYNTTDSAMRVYTGTGWINASSAQVATMKTYVYVATAAQTTFSGSDVNGSSLTYVAPYLIVSLNGLELRPVVDYTATSGLSVVLTSAATAGDELQIQAFSAFNVANIQSANVNYQQGGTGSTVRSVDAKLKEFISVKDFGVVGDGVTNNTAAYSAMISALPAGSTIYWPKGTYVGDFISSKPFILKGNGSTLIGAGNFSVIEFQGTLGSYVNLGAAPAYGHTSLTGVTGLTSDAMVLLYSGNVRPGDSAPVNYEVLKIKSDGTVYDKVYSDQNGGAPKYAVVTPVTGVEIYDFEFAAGVSTAHAIFIRYAENVWISNISMTGGEASTIALRSTINATVDHIRRIKPSATGSGQGYNVALNITKYVKVDRVYGEETRHDFDQDSSYVTDVSGVISVNCQSSSIVPSHTGFGGFTSIRDCTVRSDSYAINTSSQGASDPATLMFRHLVIDNISITNTKNMAAYDFYVGIYLQYPTENVSIKNVTVKNTNNATSFDYKNGTYNTAYYVIRAYRPDDVFDVENIVVDAATAVVWVDNVSALDINTSGVTVRNLKVSYFRDIVVVQNVLGASRGDVSVEDVKFYESSSLYGRSIVAVLATSNRLRKLMIRGLYQIPFYAKSVYLEPGAGVPGSSYIDTAGFTRRLSSLNALASGGTITQNDYLLRGDFAIWGSTSKTLSTTEPIELPVTSGNIFAIFNYGSGTLTIPGGSNTVDNASAINMAPNKTYYFMANSAGTKWTLMKVVTGDSLS